MRRAVVPVTNIEEGIVERRQVAVALQRSGRPGDSATPDDPGPRNCGHCFAVISEVESRTNRRILIGNGAILACDYRAE